MFVHVSHTLSTPSPSVSVPVSTIVSQASQASPSVSPSKFA
jgi:hypothetical protein